MNPKRKQKRYSVGPPVGRWLEYTLLPRIEKCVIEYMDGQFRLATSNEDKMYGTDCVIDGINVDITLDINRKDYSIKDKTKIVHPAAVIKYGVRFGNSVKEFLEPVLVIGFDLNHNKQWTDEERMNKFLKQISLNDMINIINTGKKIYYNSIESKRKEAAVK